MFSDIPRTRRGFFATTGALGVGFLISGFPRLSAAAEKQGAKEGEISPVEDLMREHGVLRRVLLIYEEILKRVEGGKIPGEVVAGSAGIISRFIQKYHEMLEEEELFPRFEKAGKLAELVKVLYAQHQAGRRLTEIILQSSTPAALADSGSRQKLGESLHRFIRMYRPHAAWEDTVLFPAFRAIVPAKEYDELGEVFEEKEEELFGKGGFQKIVAEVAALEKTLGIYELSQFTPGA